MRVRQPQYLCFDDMRVLLWGNIPASGRRILPVLFLSGTPSSALAIMLGMNLRLIYGKDFYSIVITKSHAGYFPVSCSLVFLPPTTSLKVTLAHTASAEAENSRP